MIRFAGSMIVSSPVLSPTKCGASSTIPGLLRLVRFDPGPEKLSADGYRGGSYPEVEACVPHVRTRAAHGTQRMRAYSARLRLLPRMILELIPIRCSHTEVKVELTSVAFESPKICSEACSIALGKLTQRTTRPLRT